MSVDTGGGLPLNGKKHMKEKHAILPEESWFVGQSFDPSKLELEIKTEVTDTDVEKAVTK